MVMDCATREVLGRRLARRGNATTAEAVLGVGSGVHYSLHPEQSGLVKRFIGSIKEECIWHYGFESLSHARGVIGR